jgi:HTH-type transcriptional regulator, sugar sensing transcriptional regulator
MKDELRQYGLSTKEAEVYLACLKLGEASAQRIAEITGIRRSTVYEVLTMLKTKGLMTTYRKDKKFYFCAAEPTKLIDRLKEKEAVIQRVLPELEKLQKSLNEKPTIELFEGLIGMKNCIEDMLASKEILVYGASNTGDEIFGSFISNFAQKRGERGINMRAVIEEPIPKHMLNGKAGRLTKVRTQKFLKGHNSAYFLYDNKMIVLTLGQELRAIKITSPLMVESQKEIFEYLWKNGKKSSIP